MHINSIQQHKHTVLPVLKLAEFYVLSIYKPTLYYNRAYL